jgi:hypothetical protein
MAARKGKTKKAKPTTRRAATRPAVTVRVPTLQRWRSHRRYAYSPKRGALPVLVSSALTLMEAHNRKTTDVLWVGTHDGSFSGTWDDFKAIKQGIAKPDLVIAGDGWWLVRLPGSANNRNHGQHWIYIEPPVHVPEHQPLAAIARTLPPSKSPEERAQRKRELREEREALRAARMAEWQREERAMRRRGR